MQVQNSTDRVWTGGGRCWPAPAPIPCRPRVAPIEPAESNVTNPDHLGPRPFWQFLERDNAQRPAVAVLGRLVDIVA
ncbi:MAG: hypothetical protein JSR77_00495 [Planctomycetes bacterium]|nr:hypothetical protein [Planctomycetota bacterium]